MSKAPSPPSKDQTHQAFDKVWQLYPAQNDVESQHVRSLWYRAWGAVLAGELSDVSGVIDPYQGGQHIREMNEQHRAKLHEFVSALLKDHKGNTSLMAVRLNLWGDKLQKNVLNQAYGSEAEKNKAIAEWLDNDPMVQRYRQLLGFKNSIEAPAPTPAQSSEAEADEKTAPIPAAATPASPHQPLTLQNEHYINGLTAEINGDVPAAFASFKEAAALGHAESNFRMYQYSMDTKEAIPSESAFAYLVAAAENNHHLARTYLRAYHHMQKLDSPHAKQLEQAAESHNATSDDLFAYGHHLDHILKDPKKAASYYIRAIAKDNHKEARVAHSILYVSGSIAVSDEIRRQHIKLLDQLATENHTGALVALGKAYARVRRLEDATEVRIKTSQSYLKKALELGDKTALLTMHVNNFSLPLTHSKRQQSVSYLQNEAYGNNPDAMKFIGIEHAKHHRYEEALFWYRASQKVNPEDLDSKMLVDAYEKNFWMREQDRITLNKVTKAITILQRLKMKPSDSFLNNQMEKLNTLRHTDFWDKAMEQSFRKISDFLKPYASATVVNITRR